MDVRSILLSGDFAKIHELTLKVTQPGSLQGEATPEQLGDAADIACQLDALAAADDREPFEAIRDLPTISSLLAWAAREDQLDIVRSLLVSGVDPNDREYGDALLEAISYGHTEMFDLLWSHGARFASNDVPYVHAAAASGGLEMLEQIARVGCDLRASSDVRGCALHAAAELGAIEVVDYLLDAGLEIDDKSKRGATPMDVAVTHGRHEFIAALKERGAGAESSGEELDAKLLLAAKHANRDDVRALLQRGADVNVVDEHGNTPLIWAIHGPLPNDPTKGGDIDTIRALIDAGADIDHVPAENCGVGDTTTDAILAAMVEPPALVLAAQRNLPSVVRVLLDAGADASVTDTAGRNALDVARREGFTQIVELLEAS